MQRLELPGEIIENGQETAKYDIDSGMLSIKIPKVNNGEEFKELDMLTKLIQASPSQRELFDKMGSKGGPGSISVIDTDEGAPPRARGNFYAPPKIESFLLSAISYGFNHAYSGYGKHILASANEIIEISDLDQSTVSSRRQQRLENEDKKFDPDYYIHDYIEANEIQELIAFKPWYSSCTTVGYTINYTNTIVNNENAIVNNENANGKPCLEAISQASNKANRTNNQDVWSEKEKSLLLQLKNKSFLIENKQAVYLGLVDILYAYTYNHRTTMGENTVESSWNIQKQSSLLSCFEEFSSLSETLIACIRRTLCYPLYRNVDLSMQCLRDVSAILADGKRACLKALLAVKQLLDTDENGVIANRLWIEDYCIWIQKYASNLKSLAAKINKFKITNKTQQIGFELERLEQEAQEAMAEMDTFADE